MSDQIRRAWDKGGVAIYVAFAVLLAMGFGYSICASQGRDAMVQLAEQQRLERASLTRAHKVEVKYLRERLSESKAVIINLANQSSRNTATSAEAAKTAVEALKQNSEVKP